MDSLLDQGLALQAASLKSPRQQLLIRMELLFNRWRHHQVGWDISGSREERDEGFEKSLDLLSEAYEFING